jgi:NTE family protein
MQYLTDKTFRFAKLFIFAILLIITFSKASPILFRLSFEAESMAGSFPLKHPALKKAKIGLALSGGGARGLAHIGVLKTLEKEKIPIHYIAGTSMGSVIGGLYAAGLSASQIETIALNMNWNEIFVNLPQRTSLFSTQRTENGNYLLELSIQNGKIVLPTGLSAGQRLIQLLIETTLEADFSSRGDFDRLPIPFRAIATDVLTGNKVVLKNGSLTQAIRASFAVPFAFTPMEKDSLLLFDGGMVDNLPLDVAKNMGADFVIGVDVIAPLQPKEKLNNPIQLLDQIVALNIQEQNRNLKDTADLLIKPELEGHLPVDFTGVGGLIRQGEKSAEKMIPLLKHKLDSLARNFSSARFPLLADLKITGAERISPDTVRKYLSLKTDDSLNAFIIHQALQNVYNSGYFESAEAEIDTAGSRTMVCVKIKEYPLQKPFRIEGNTVFSSPEIQNIFAYQKEKTINYNQVLGQTEALLEKYRKAGYSLASIKTIEDKGDYFRCIVEEGKISAISVTGNNHTQETVIRREFTLHPKDLFQLEKAKRMIQQVYSTGLFEQVTLEIQSGLGLRIHVKEKPKQRIQFGLRYDDVRYGEGFGRFILDNVGGSGNRWVNHFQFGLRREKYSSYLTGDRLGGTYLFHQSGVYLYKDKRYLADSIPNELTLRTLRKIGASVALGHQIRRLGQVSIVLRSENFPIDTLDREWLKSNLGDFSEGIRAVSIRSNVDDLNRLPFPTSGRKHFFSVDFAHDVIGGTERFMNFVMSLEEYYSFGDFHTFFPRFQMTYADQPLPLVEQHSIGGYSSVLTNDDISFYNDFPLLGFSERAFSGDCLALLNLRYRYKALPWMYLFFQFDIGDVWKQADFEFSRSFAKQEIKDLKQGLGLGISLDLPFGPLTLVMAQPISRLSEKEKVLVQNIYLSAGYDF